MNVGDTIVAAATPLGYSGVAVYSKYKPEQFSSGFGKIHQWQE